MPFGWAVVAFAAYQTVVVSFVAVAAVVLSIIGAPLAGIPAQTDVLDALFVSALYEASKPFVPIPVVPVATAKPHVLFASAIGAVLVPVLAGKLLPPLASVVVASLSATVRVYPAELFVLTLTVSLLLLTTPPDVGVIEMATLEPVLMLMVDPTDTLIVVFSVSDAAETSAGDAMTANDATVIPKLKSGFLIAGFFIVFLLIIVLLLP